MMITKIPTPPCLGRTWAFYELSEPFTWRGHVGRHVGVHVGLETVEPEPYCLGVFLCWPDGRIMGWENLLWEDDSPDWAYGLDANALDVTTGKPGQHGPRGYVFFGSIFFPSRHAGITFANYTSNPGDIETNPPSPKPDADEPAAQSWRDRTPLL